MGSYYKHPTVYIHGSQYIAQLRNMQIKQVHAHFLISIGNYSNERIGFTVDLEEGESLEEIVSQLRNKAIEIVGESAEDLYNKKWQAERSYQEVENRVNRLRKEWDDTAEFLKAQGINPQAPSMPQFRNLIRAANNLEYEAVTEAEFIN